MTESKLFAGTGLLGADVKPGRRTPSDPLLATIKVGNEALESKAAEEHEIALDAAEFERVGTKYIFCLEEKAVPKLPESKQRKYGAAAQCFHEHCERLDVRSLPCREGVLAGYLDALTEQGISYQKLKLVVDAIDHRHQLAELFEPGNYPLIRAMLLFQKRKAKAKKGNGTITQKGN